MFYMAASVLTLITAVGYSRALLFASRDLDTLLSMPVSHLTLLLSKLAGLYVYELIFLAVLFVPAYITYFIVAGFTVSGLFTLLVGVLFGPLIPLALGGDLPGNEIQSPMAKVILGGLLTSTFLNGFIVPIVYLMMHRKKAQKSL